jgi:hypothetical protein
MKRFLKHSLVAVLALALLAFVAGCGSKSSQSPEEAMKSALEKTATVTSGKFSLKGSFSAANVPGALALTGDGAFDTKAANGGSLEMTIAIDVAGTKQEFGVVTVGGDNYLVYDGKALKNTKSTDGGLKPGEVGKLLDGLGTYLTDVKETSSGTYTASVDVKKAIADGKGNKDLSALSIPGLGSGEQLQKSLGQATISVTVNDAGYAEKMDFNIPITQNGSQGGVRITVTLTDINKPVTIEQPTNVVSSPSDLGGFGAAIAGQ